MNKSTKQENKPVIVISVAINENPVSPVLTSDENVNTSVDPGEIMSSCLSEPVKLNR